MSTAAPVPPRLRRSRHISWFGHMGAVYLFHDLYGYIMEMSPDIADMIEAFSDGVDTEETIEYFKARFTDADPRQFVEVLAAHAVLIAPEEDEIEGMWAFVPIKGKWNIWQRRNDRLTLWTAWGERPVQQLFFDEDETKIWDAIDGQKRLIELRHHHDNAKIISLLRRLVHHDVQAVKMSMMPWAIYAKRPAMAPAYLASTMPYPAWQPGTPVPPAPSLEHYHTVAITEADAQFDHQETTLSHLLRVPHPALAAAHATGNGAPGTAPVPRSYGQALVDVLLARDLVHASARRASLVVDRTAALAEGISLAPSARTGALRVLEIGGGLGYVAHDVIQRLRDAGHDVQYTIIELSPALANAQRARLEAYGDDVRWIEGDVLQVKLDGRAPRPAGSAAEWQSGSIDETFDLILSNEMAGDLPARQLSRPDIGLAAEGGSVDPEKLRAFSPIAADLGIVLDDAPEPFYLQTGAIELIARIQKWLAPGGTAIVTEFGDIAIWPRLSSQLDHPELSTHFGHLMQTARGLGLEAKMEFVIDLLDFDRTQTGLATTRSHFRALRALAADAGVDLPKIGYTPALLSHTVGDKLDLATVGELRWDKIEDRLMGLVPHEFKALLIKKPATL